MRRGEPERCIRPLPPWQRGEMPGFFNSLPGGEVASRTFKDGYECEHEKGESIMNILRAILGIAFAIYVAIGVLLVIVHPRLDTMDELQATLKGRRCTPQPTAVILLWPYYLNYFYGGGFDGCRKGLYK